LIELLAVEVLLYVSGRKWLEKRLVLNSLCSYLATNIMKLFDYANIYAIIFCQGKSREAYR